MKLLHQLGHNATWNVNSYFEHEIGDGFIFNAYSFDRQSLLQKKIWKHDPEKFKDISMVDLQFFGSKDTRKRNFETYSFHPANDTSAGNTNLSLSSRALLGIEMQEGLGLEKIIIPCRTIEKSKIDEDIWIFRSIATKLQKLPGKEYYLTLALSWDVLTDRALLDKILFSLTSVDIPFDGYYFVHEVTDQRLNKKKINTDYKCLDGIWTVLSSLKMNGFKTIYGFANWDSMVLLSLIDIDYITIWTFENLRSFNSSRYTKEKSDWWFSEGWYFSEKLLNFIKAANLSQIRLRRWMDIIRNDYNVFSDAILKENFVWASGKPPIHINYLTSLSRMLKSLWEEVDMAKRRNMMLSRIEEARIAYEQLREKKIVLLDESSDYHITPWKEFILSK